MSRLMDLADYAREYLEVEEGDYYWEEWESGLDHADVESLSEFAKHFFLMGIRHRRELVEKVENQ